MSAAGEKTRNFASRLAEAIEKREDGEPELSAELFEALFAEGGGDADAAVQYAITLLKLDRTEDADRILGDALRHDPDHFELNRAWAGRPRHGINFEATIARGRAFRAKFPPRAHPPAWESFAVELDCHYEMGKWDRLADVLQESWDDLTGSPEILADTIAAHNKLFLTEDLARLAREAPEAAWRHLPEKARDATLTKTGIAAQNAAMIEATGLKIVSIGQNCLPYQLGGRWGLLGPRADPTTLTPFDLGGFTNDSAADAIATDFEAFGKRENFDVTRAWGGGQMFNHRPTNVGFFHERGSFWVTPDRSRFHTRMALMMTNWQLAMRAPKKLYVFCLCGNGSLERLVRVVSEKLLGPAAHLLVLDVLQQPHDCPAGPFISYRHVPYPRDYEWTRVEHQCAAEGLAFETAVVEAIGWAAVKLDASARAYLPYLREEPPAAPPPATGFSREVLSENFWNFGNGHGNILSETFGFGENGEIEGYQNDNESSWRLENNTLKIFRRDGALMWTAGKPLQDPSGRWQLRLTTPHDPDLEFFLNQGAPRQAAGPAARRPAYAGVKRVLILRSGLEIEKRLRHSLAGAQLFFISRENEIENFPDCNMFIADLVLTHAASAAQAAAFIARITARFPVALFIELSSHHAGYLALHGMQNFHRRFDENTFMDSLSLDFVAGSASATVYKIEHFGDVPAFDSYKDWVVSSVHPHGTIHGARGEYLIFDRPVFEISVFACHGFEALDLPLAADLTLVEMRSPRLRPQSSGFRLDHVAHPRELGTLLYHTPRDAPAAWRERPISLPVLLDDHEIYRSPAHQALLTRWRGELKIEIAELSVYELPACVIGGTGTLFCGGRFVWGTDYLLMFLSTSAFDPIMTGLQRRHPVQHIDGVAICGFNALYDNYYHFVAEALASMSLCIDLLARSSLPRITLVTGKLNATRRQYLDLLVRGDPRFAVVDLERDEFVTADTVIYCDNVGRVVHQQVCWEEIPLAAKLIAAAGLTDIRPSRLLYVARTDTKGRAMRNEQALIARLAALGFQIFVGSEYSVAEQIRTFREARLIVAPHGAGLTNVLFCHPGTVVLELQQSGYVNTGMMRLAQLGNLKYFSEVFFPAGSDNFDDTWVVDVERVISTIEKLK